MKVKLISYTPDALNLLLGTKSARMRGEDPSLMSDSERYSHFQYMLNTIKSPFEFVDYVFDISEVSKNFTHQLVRTRTGAYQQETSRALKVSAFDSVRPKSFDHLSEEDKTYMDTFGAISNQQIAAELWDDAIATVDAAYNELLELGAATQDARAILPSNMSTKIQAKFSLRTLSDMAKVRLCTRTQGEYQQVFRKMRELVLEIHPWAEPLLQVNCVANGQCAFPRHGKEYCVFWRDWMDLDSKKDVLRQDFWELELQENNPVANNGTSKG